MAEVINVSGLHPESSALEFTVDGAGLREARNVLAEMGALLKSPLSRGITHDVKRLIARLESTIFDIETALRSDVPVARPRELRPRVITLCGSSRFPDAFHLANLHFSLQGKVVIGLGAFGHADAPTGARFLTSDGDESTAEKRALDSLHFRKIDLCDEIHVINVGGYLGSSTRREIAYAQQQGKAVTYMFPVT